MSESEQARLAQAVADLDENTALEIVRLRMARGDDPMRIIDDCQEGMREVGRRYAQQRYFLSGLIMAGDILRQIMDLVVPTVDARGSAPSPLAGGKSEGVKPLAGHALGRVLIGTVRGDIHDLGKNMVTMLLRSHGFAVVDLGVDVPPERFVDAARSQKPDIIGLSGLITASHNAMRETAGALQAMMAEDGTQIPIVIGGQVDEQVCAYVGAGYWTTDAMEGVQICRRLVGQGGQGPASGCSCKN